MTRFNVATNPWIPCIDSENKRLKVSLIELFSNSNITEFEGDPIEKYCLIRFCGSIAQSSKKNQPCDVGEWKAIRNIYASNTIEYLENNLDLFWMDGDKPFLQFNPITEDASTNSELYPIQLREHFAIGNNVVQYGQQITPTYTIESLVLDLIVHMIFSPTFGKSGAVPSRAMLFFNSPKGNINIYATTKNIVESIWYNMEWAGDFGIPSWESRFNSNESVLARQVPLTVRIHITNNMKEMYYCKGLEYPENISNTQYHIPAREKFLNSEIDRPMSTTRNGKWWRDFEAFVCKTNATNVFSFERTKNIDTLIVHTLGGVYKPQSGLYYTTKLNTSKYEFKNPEKITNTEFHNMYKNIIKKSNDVSNVIKGQVVAAISSYVESSSKNKKLYESANSLMETFDNELDINSNLIPMFDLSEAQNKWNSILFNAVNHLADKIEQKYGIVAGGKFRLNQKIKNSLQ